MLVYQRVGLSLLQVLILTTTENGHNGPFSSSFEQVATTQVRRQCSQVLRPAPETANFQTGRRNVTKEWARSHHLKECFRPLDQVWSGINRMTHIDTISVMISNAIPIYQIYPKHIALIEPAWNVLKPSSSHILTTLHAPSIAHSHNVLFSASTKAHTFSAAGASEALLTLVEGKNHRKTCMLNDFDGGKWQKEWDEWVYILMFLGGVQTSPCHQCVARPSGWNCVS